MTNFTAECDEYLNERTGKYEYRAVRYEAAAHALRALGLDNNDTLLDLGAGMTEFDYCLRTYLDWRGRYIPLDGGIDGVNIEEWTPPRKYDWVVGLEILEHLHNPGQVMGRLMGAEPKGIIVSVPNPRTVDVIGIDRTHVTIITKEFLESWGFSVAEATFYGGVFSNGEPDCLFGIWQRPW